MAKKNAKLNKEVLVGVSTPEVALQSDLMSMFVNKTIGGKKIVSCEMTGEKFSLTDCDGASFVLSKSELDEYLK